MAKSKVTLSIDPYTWEKAKSTYDSASQRVQELIEADIDATQVEDEELLERKISELEEEKEELEREKEEIEEELVDVEAELSVARSALERSNREDKKQEELLEDFKESAREKTKRTKWEEPEDIPGFWVEDLDKSAEELVEIAEEARKNG